MILDQIKIVENELILPEKLRIRLKLRFPFHRIPTLQDYSKEIITYSKRNRILPFFMKEDINNDGVDEVILVQKLLIGGFGRLLIISESKGKLEFEKIRWKKPINALFFDYLIEKSDPRVYQLFGLRNKNEEKKVTIERIHLRTKSYLNRIVFWDGKKYKQEKISFFDD